MTDPRQVEPRFKEPKPVVEKTAAQRRGSNNRRKGMRKQLEVRKAFQEITGTSWVQFHTQGGNEETWLSPLRVECKAGKQVGPLTTKFLAAEEQSEASRALGDVRPFALVAKPDGWAKHDGIFACRMADLARVIEGLVYGA